MKMVTDKELEEYRKYVQLEEEAVAIEVAATVNHAELPVPDDDSNYWGTCPFCHATTSMLNTGKAHWFYCDAHKTRWSPGSNLFSGWRNETKDEQRAKYEAKDFGSYRHVEPYHDKSRWPFTDAEHDILGDH
jgi:hypothetical protein